MKDLFVDMREIPMEIRLEVGFIVIRKICNCGEIRHSANDLLFIPGDEPGEHETAEWYSFGAQHGCATPIVSIHELFEYGGPKPMPRGADIEPSRATETAEVPEGSLNVKTLLSAKGALQLSKHEWLTGKNEERDNVLAGIAEAARSGATSIEVDALEENTVNALEELGYSVGRNYQTNGKLYISWEDEK